MDALDHAALAFFSRGGGAARLDDLIADFAPVARAAGYTSAACHHIARPGHPIAPRLLFGWNLDETDQRLLDRMLTRGDAAIARLFLSAAPLALEELAPPDDDADDSLTLIRLRGLIVPLHGPLGEIICVALFGGPATADARTRRTLQTAAALLANRGAALADTADDASPASEPSRREALCARLAHAGMNDWEIGRALGVSEDAVAIHFERLKAKLGVSRRSEILPQDWLNIAPLDD